MLHRSLYSPAYPVFGRLVVMQGARTPGSHGAADTRKCLLGNDVRRQAVKLLDMDSSIAAVRPVMS